MDKLRGFTLLEVLVALAVLAISMAAISRAAGAGSGHVEAMRVRTVADWVAQDRLAVHTARSDWLPVGVQSGEEMQLGRRYLWREEISSTPNPTLRRIVVTVAMPEEPDYMLRQLTGYLVMYPR